ncbi:MAG: WYL domain-containing protein [Arachnia sp.]
MSARKSERLVNLLIALLSTRRFLTRHELREIVEGYRGGSDAAFERQFERDKEELRGLGVRIETGFNDALFEDEEGYRINREDFELPEISFTPEELAVLGVASQVWQDSVAADHTAQAFEALRAGGAAPDLSLVPALRPQLAVREADFDVIYDAVLRRVPLGFDYGGRRRRVQPWRLLQRRGSWYLFGYDLDRSADRFFKLSRFGSRAEQEGKPGAYEVPVDAAERSARLAPVDAATAVVALRAGAAIELSARAVDWPGTPEGFVAHEVGGVHERAIVDAVVAAGPDAILLDPPELRRAAIERLTAVAR